MNRLGRIAALIVAAGLFYVVWGLSQDRSRASDQADMNGVYFLQSFFIDELKRPPNDLPELLDWADQKHLEERPVTRLRAAMARGEIIWEHHSEETFMDVTWRRRQWITGIKNGSLYLDKLK